MKPLERDIQRFSNEVTNLVLRAVVAVTGLKPESAAKVGPGEVSPAKGLLVEMVPMEHLGEFERRREDLSQEASPVATALSGAFAELASLSAQQREMTALLTQLDERLSHRREKLARA